MLDTTNATHRETFQLNYDKDVTMSDIAVRKSHPSSAPRDEVFEFHLRRWYSVPPLRASSNRISINHRISQQLTTTSANYMSASHKSLQQVFLISEA
ncbi:uncharacterized protein RSE6_05709 [Rhynchosporium secalis]|uniref:Uncharacterized protein n=1 Tax=Rhynchosporium secalis TaxID=38038 RepID=A0A1E1M8H5_RHYSE|nr:uncharacterized protein RSE6_05709 [Rhynchosporium secalis]